MDSWWHFLFGSSVGLLIYSLTYHLFGTMIGETAFRAISISLTLDIDISTLRFFVSSFLALYGSALLHLPMDYLWDEYISPKRKTDHENVTSRGGV